MWLQDVSHAVEGDRNGTPVAGVCGCRLPAPTICNGECHLAKMKLHVESKADGTTFVIAIHICHCQFKEGVMQCFVVGMYTRIERQTYGLDVARGRRNENSTTKLRIRMFP